MLVNIWGERNAPTIDPPIELTEQEEWLYDAYLKCVADSKAAILELLTSQKRRDYLEKCYIPLTRQRFALCLQKMSTEKRIAFAQKMFAGYEAMREKYEKNGLAKRVLERLSL